LLFLQVNIIVLPAVNNMDLIGRLLYFGIQITGESFIKQRRLNMKTKLRYGLGVFLSVLFLWACGSTKTAAEKERQAAEIQNALEISTFLFEATYAYPTGYRSVYLSPYYDVKVSPDTVKAYLPYYGRAYRAPMDPREGGFNFTSTDFEYRVSPGKRKGSWVTVITIRDLDRPVTFNFDVWENGTARLGVNDMNRQPISFQGNIETTKEETVKGETAEGQ